MPATKSPPISVLAYSDYRAFLKDHYDWAHGLDRRFSHRYIGSRVGSNSSGWFSDLLKARIDLARTQLVKLIALLKLEEKEGDYFEALVHYNQAASLDAKNRYYKKLLEFRDMQSQTVGRDKFEYYSKWYYSAIRELLFFYDFRGDYQALARKLNPPIKVSEAREGIKLLENLGFIRKDAQGRYRPFESVLKKDPSFKSLFAVNFLKANLDLGAAALERFGKEERHISALVLSFSKDGLKKAVTEVEALRRKLLALMEEDPHPEKVYQVNLQLFPITQ